MPKPTLQEQVERKLKRQWQRQQQLVRSSSATQLPAYLGLASTAQKAAQNEGGEDEDENTAEEQWQRDLRVQQHQRQRGISRKEKLEGMVSRLQNPELDLQDQENLQTLQKMRQAVSSGSTVQAVKAGAEIGYELRQRIAAGSFQGFLMALGLAAVKDLWDFITEFFDAGLTGSLLNILITTALIIIVMFQGIWFKRFIIKKFWKRYVAVAIAEFIPIVNFFPWWTISIILVKQQADKKRKEYQRASEQLEMDLEEIKSLPETPARVRTKKTSTAT